MFVQDSPQLSGFRDCSPPKTVHKNLMLKVDIFCYPAKPICFNFYLFEVLKCALISQFFLKGGPLEFRNLCGSRLDPLCTLKKRWTKKIEKIVKDFFFFWTRLENGSFYIWMSHVENDKNQGNIRMTSRSPLMLQKWQSSEKLFRERTLFCKPQILFVERSSWRWKKGGYDNSWS